MSLNYTFYMSLKRIKRKKCLAQYRLSVTSFTVKDFYDFLQGKDWNVLNKFSCILQCSYWSYDFDNW